jgi:hypothetical protein
LAAVRIEDSNALKPTVEIISKTLTQGSTSHNGSVRIPKNGTCREPVGMSSHSSGFVPGSDELELVPIGLKA